MTTSRFAAGQVCATCSKNAAKAAPSLLPDELTRGIIECPEHRAPLINAGSGHDQWRAAALPDRCQEGVGMELAFIHADQAEASPGRCPLFWSSVSACLAAATVSASWRWDRSCRGRR